MKVCQKKPQTEIKRKFLVLIEAEEEESFLNLWRSFQVITNINVFCFNAETEQVLNKAENQHATTSLFQNTPIFSWWMTHLSSIPNRNDLTRFSPYNITSTNNNTLTRTRQVSTNAKVPERPIPALQCTTEGPCSGPREPDSRTLKRKLRKEAGDSGTPKSGHVV